MSEIRNLLVGVRFSKTGKVYNFDATEIADIKIGDSVVVETSRGMQLGEVAQLFDTVELDDQESLKPVLRRATSRDLMLQDSWQQKEAAVVKKAQEKVTEMGLAEIKVVDAEYSYDGTRLTVLFSHETEEKIDLKAIKKVLQRIYNPAQVDLRQIGPRDVAKVIEGIGACGLEKRCCSKFLTEFSSISIRMAKDQGVSLTPSEITGMCGRLRCCLNYEYEVYAEARKSLPKRNKHVITPQGAGKVIDSFPLKNSVLVDIPEVGRKEFDISDIKIADDTKKS